MSNQDPPQASVVLLEWLNAAPLHKLLVLGETSVSLLDALSADASSVPASADVARAPSARRWLEAMATQPRYDAAVASDVLETLAEAQATAVLAGLRDVHAGRLLLFTTTAAQVAEADLLALGLTRLGTVVLRDAALRAYEYDLSRYKRTPDWLNARHWAHPERWGKDRW